MVLLQPKLHLKVSQRQIFTPGLVQMVSVLALNKLDGSAKGGAVLAIADALKLPISVVGLGEGLDDWAPFDPDAFARGLFE